MKKTFLSLLFSSLVIVTFSGCFPANDRCWVRPDRHEQARRLHERTGSIELTAQTLREADWLECEINEVVYRLENENSL
jgi:hypothetical protein